MMRVWDNELLFPQNPVKTETLRVSERLTDAQAIYSTYILPFLSESFIHIKAVVHGNETHTRAVQTMYAYKGSVWNLCSIVSPSRTIAPTAGYEAILSAGAEIDVHYLKADAVRDLQEIRVCETYRDTAAEAYTLSNDISADFAAPHIPMSGKCVLYTLPETPTGTSQQLRIMETVRLGSNVKVDKFRRYGASTIYDVSASYAAKLNKNMAVLTIAVDLDKLGG